MMGDAMTSARGFGVGADAVAGGAAGGADDGVAAAFVQFRSAWPSPPLRIMSVPPWSVGLSRRTPEYPLLLMHTMIVSALGPPMIWNEYFPSGVTAMLCAFPPAAVLHCSTSVRVVRRAVEAAGIRDDDTVEVFDRKMFDDLVGTAAARTSSHPAGAARRRRSRGCPRHHVAADHGDRVFPLHRRGLSSVSSQARSQLRSGRIVPLCLHWSMTVQALTTDRTVIA
jgi:hypothetical protein